MYDYNCHDRAQSGFSRMRATQTSRQFPRGNSHMKTSECSSSRSAVEIKDSGLILGVLWRNATILFLFLFFVIREYNAYNTITDGTLFRLLKALIIYNIFTTYKTLLTNAVTTRGKEKKEQ